MRKSAVNCVRDLSCKFRWYVGGKVWEVKTMREAKGAAQSGEGWIELEVAFTDADGPRIYTEEMPDPREQSWRKVFRTIEDDFGFRLSLPAY